MPSIESNLNSTHLKDAAVRLAPYLTTTPVLENQRLNRLAGRRVLLKAELLNATGSFKIRGALNTLLQIREHAETTRTNAEPTLPPIVALSSGNHAQAVAQAASWLNMQATIVMPHDAPALKLRKTRELGADVQIYQRPSEDREAIARDLVSRLGAKLVHPFDQPSVIAGQGTVGLELAAYATAAGVQLGAVAAPCSGGGLIAGVGMGLRDTFPDVELIAVEPSDYDDYRQSFAAGKPVSLSKFPPTLCDSLQVNRPGDLTFQINQQLGCRAVTVTDEQILQAMHFSLVELKLSLEPGGAAALAALLFQQLPTGSTAVGLILSGGNVDPALIQQALATPRTTWLGSNSDPA